MAMLVKPTKHFLNLKERREVFRRLVQCMTGHAYTGEFRHTFLPHSTDTTACPCDNKTLESRNHILRECPRYKNHRGILRKTSRSLALSTILGTVEGVTVLAKFIAKSGAFSRTGSVIPSQTVPRQDLEPDPTWSTQDGPKMTAVNRPSQPIYITEAQRHTPSDKLPTPSRPTSLYN
jgi:hypothetical protein